MSTSLRDEQLAGDPLHQNIPDLMSNTSMKDHSILEEDIKVAKETELPTSVGISIDNNSHHHIKDQDISDLQIKKEPPITSEAALGGSSEADVKETSKISAYARLDFENHTFFVQTLQVILGRKSNDELLNGSQHAVDVHLSSKKAISRRHARIFYNFGTQRFELSVLGRNGAFVDDLFIEKGRTVPLVDGTKIQIGDIPFSFILPSIEANQSKDSISADQPFNPSDAISLRSSLYSTSKSNTPSKQPPKKAIPDVRRNSRSIRRLSEARRKSLASATNEEIGTLLSELGVNSIEDIDEQDPVYVDAQIRAILGDGHESAIMDDEEEEDDELNGTLPLGKGSLSQFDVGEEDELDQLVKQHNMEQGVDLDSLDKNDSIDASIIDDEIANLAPLIAHNQEKDSNVDIYRNGSNSGNNGYSTGGARNGPLMGKPATPRMGKPASIQPPASRLYGRGIPIDTRLTGLPTHLVPQGPGDYSALKVSQPLANSLAKPYYPARPPAPELLVPIQTIEQKPIQQAEMIIDKITVHTQFLYPPVHIAKVVGKPFMVPKIPKRKKDQLVPKKPIKNVYTINEIPEHYRTKPTLSFPVMIINVLKFKNEAQGLTLNEIYEGVKEIYPYYKYCPDGWQSVVIHNIKLNKLFKTDDDERWVIDETFVQEKEKIRKKQQELATQRAKEAVLRAEELKQKQRLEMQQSISQNIVGRDFNSPYLLTQTQLLAQYQKQGAGKPKTIAELASEIRREGNSKTPMYFKSQGSPSNIKAQLAANRSNYSPSASASPPPTSGANSQGAASNSTPSKPQSPMMNQDTKKSLSYLQKELFTLYKARKLSYNTATTTEIITKALATTIAQVNVIGSKAGVGDNALSFLVERAPQQVSKILDIALTKSIKEKQGMLASRNTSRGTTPGPSQISSPKRAESELVQVVEGLSSLSQSDIVIEANEKSNPRSEPGTPSPEKDKSDQNSLLGKPPLFAKSSTPTGSNGNGLSKPQSGGLGRPQSYGKPAAPTASGADNGLLKPPQFVLNRPPTRPVYGSKPSDEIGGKRTNDDAANEQEQPNKASKQE